MVSITIEAAARFARLKVVRCYLHHPQLTSEDVGVLIMPTRSLGKYHS